MWTQTAAQHYHDPTSYFFHQVSHTAGTKLPLTFLCSCALFKMRFTFLMVRVEEPYHRKDKHSFLGAVDGSHSESQPSFQGINICI